MLKRQIWETLGTRFLVFGFGSIGSILLTRSLGPEGRGMYLGMINLVLLGSQIGTLGLASSNTYYLSSGREDGRALASNTLVLSVVVGTLLAAIGWFVADRFLGLRPAIDVPAMLAGLATIPLGILLLLGENLLLAKGAVAVFNRVELWRNLSWSALVVVFAVALGWGVRAVIWLNAFAFAVATIWVWLQLERLGLAPRLRWYGTVFRRTIGYGLKAYAVTFLAFLLMRVDALLVQYWRGAVDGGYYGVAVQLGDLILTISTTIAMVAFPKAAETGAAAWPMIRRLTLITGTAVAGICVAGYVLAPWGIRLLFGAPFLRAVSAFRILLPGIWMLSVGTLLVQYLNGLGMPIAILWTWLAVTAMNLGMNAYLIPHMGIDGAAWASTFAYSLAGIVVVMLVVRDRRSRRVES
jgi:O-antigen/teichoic acid export membrane protein